MFRAPAAGALFCGSEGRSSPRAAAVVQPRAGRAGEGSPPGRRQSRLQGPGHARPALRADGAWIVQLPGASTRLPGRDLTHEERLRPREDGGEAASGQAHPDVTEGSGPGQAGSQRGACREPSQGPRGLQGRGLVRAQERRARRSSRLGAGPGAAMLILAAGGARAWAGPWV